MLVTDRTREAHARRSYVTSCKFNIKRGREFRARRKRCRKNDGSGTGGGGGSGGGADAPGGV